ncbi:hypothetical protein JGI24_01452 [Candidatus Kryptobacter tengchongensis]|uniref:Uncharacterized protein n=1 Tax=Kryptobacter tengchongensis TaxID=1643429 RepID=A0A656D9R0_KRYT1|nr:hypothetical protein JGI24_01452 [Candidatus Kryptobacter tengchongensis]
MRRLVLYALRILLFVLVIFSVFVGSHLLFSKPSYAELPKYSVVVCIGPLVICIPGSTYYCCVEGRPV